MKNAHGKQQVAIFLSFLLLLTMPAMPSLAVGNSVLSLQASWADGVLATSGTVTPDVLAVAVEVYSNAGTVLRLESYSVTEAQTFSGAMDFVPPASGTYTVKAANYEGGPFQTATFTYTAPISTPTPTSVPTYTPTSAPTPAPVASVSAGAGVTPIQVTISGTQAVLQITQANLAPVVGADSSGAPAEFSIDASRLAPGITSVAIPPDGLQRIAQAAEEGAFSGFRVALPQGTLEFDEGAMKSLLGLEESAGGSGTGEEAVRESLVIEIRTVAPGSLPSAQGNKLEPGAVVYDLSAMAVREDTGETRSNSTFNGMVTVRVPYVPTPGEDPDHVVFYYIDDAGTVVKMPCVYDPATGTVAFQTDHFSVFVMVREATAAFSDVLMGNWFYRAMNTAVRNGWMHGTSATTLSPDVPTTRTMLAVLLHRMEGSPSVSTGNAVFADVSANAWYSSAVRWSTSQGIMEGYGAGRFGPGDPLTREQFVAVLHRYAQLKGARVAEGTPAVLSSYRDGTAVSPWAEDAMRWAVDARILEGISPVLLAPGTSSTRAQMAVLLSRYQDWNAGRIE